LKPTANQLLCSFPYDVGSIMRQCWPRGVSDHCTPGCSRWPNDDTLWCEPGSDRWRFENPPCAWRPTELSAMMSVRETIRRDKLRPPQKTWNDGKFYSELIFDAAHFTANLPDSIEAVFYLDDNCGDAYDGPKCKNYGIGAQTAIATHFGLDNGKLPLLKLDLWNWNTPFTDVLAQPPPPRSPVVFSPPPTPPPPSPADVAKTAAQEAAPVAPAFRASCTSAWCGIFETWINGADFKFFSMWNLGFQRRRAHSWACWDWPENNNGGTANDFFRLTREGATCDRNWMDGAWGNANDRPFSSPSPALLGFDETIVEFCSNQMNMDPWSGSGDLNHKLAARCRDAHRNVLRLISGGWSMCQNLQWQMCALTGKLPGQGSSRISFATAPRDLKPEWWTNPGGTHPTYPCRGNWCDPNGFTVGDVYFAELAITTTLCRNREELYALDVGEFWECDLDETAWRSFTSRLMNS